MSPEPLTATPAEPMTDGEPEHRPSESDVPWQRLNIRLVWINGANFVISFCTGLTSFFLFDSGPIWPLLVVSGWGVLTTGRDFTRWLFTRYRITDVRVERRTGWLVREYRHVQRDRIRSVSSSAKLRHRLMRLRVVHIGSGQTNAIGATFKLDALDKGMAESLRGELLPDRLADPRERETVISRVRWHWIFYNVFHVWAALAGVLFLVSWFFTLEMFGIDLFEIIKGLIIWANLGLWWTIGLCAGGIFVLGYLGLAVEFVAKHWNFELIRTTAADDTGTAVLTRQGLLSTRTVYREDKRIRGLNILEPLLWRWMRLAETKIITTGLNASLRESANLLPRAPVSEARHVARFVFPDGVLPLEAPLRRHPPAALRRRLLWATYSPAIAAGLLLWLAETGAVPAWIWPWPFALLPVTWALAVVAYRSLGHTLAGPYVVVRHGAVGRSTSVLQCRAIIGWRLRQSILQRWGKMMTVGIPTAAGYRYYEAIDAGTGQALAFVKAATPALAKEFIET